MVSRTWAPSGPERFWKKSGDTATSKRNGSSAAAKGQPIHPRKRRTTTGDQNGDKSGCDGVGKKDFDRFDIAADDAYQISRAAL